MKPFIKKHWKPITAAICAAAVAAAVLVPKNSAKPAAASAQYVETRPEKRNIVNSYSADGTITADDNETFNSFFCDGFCSHGLTSIGLKSFTPSCSQYGAASVDDTTNRT